MADAFFSGRTEDTFQISAMNITFPVVMLSSCIGTIFGAVGNADIEAEIGKGDRECAQNFAAFSLCTAVWVSVWTLHMACIPLVLSQVFSQLFLAEGETRISAFGIAGASLIRSSGKRLCISGNPLYGTDQVSGKSYQ